MVSRVHVHQFSASVWRAARSNVASRTYKKKAWNELVGPALQRPAKSQKGASKATLRNGETAWCRGFTCTNFRPPFGVLRCQTSRPEPTKKRLGMSLQAQHYRDQQREPERGVKSHPPKRRNSMVLRVHVHQFSASVWRAARSNVASRTYKKKAWNELVGPTLPRPA